LRLRLACATIVALGSGCGTSGTFRNGIYQDEYVRYRIGQPEGDWERVAVGDNDVAYHHRALGTVSVNSTCSDYEDVPEQALLNHLFFGTRERVFRKQEVVTLDGRGALHVLADVELDGVPISLEIYLLKKDGCVYDLSYISSRSAQSQGHPVFARVVAGFHVLETNSKD
jgi:hypothetical protein